MADFSNLVTAIAGLFGLIMLILGRIPIPRWSTRRGISIRMAGVSLLAPWPLSQGLSLLAVAARKLDGDPPDKPEIVELMAAFVQLVILFWVSVIAFVLFLVTPVRKPSIR